MGESEDATQLPESWDDHGAEIAEIASEYSDDGWATLVVHPEWVVTKVSEDVDEPGFVVVVPDDEYDELLETVESGVELSGVRVDRRRDGEHAVFLVSIEDTAGLAAVLFPTYYPLTDSVPDQVRQRVRDSGPIYVRLARRDGTFLQIPVEDADLFVPPGSEE